MSDELTITGGLIDRAGEPKDFSGYTVTEDQAVSCDVVQYEWLPDVHRQLQAIAALPPGWDSYGSPSPDAHIIEAARGLLLCLCQAEALPKPHVNPTPRGGVQFEWEAGDRYFEVEVLAERAAAYLYVDDAAGMEEAGEVFEDESLEAIVSYICSVAAVQ